MKKRTILCALSLVAILGTVACQKNKPKGTASSASAPVPAAVSPSAAAAAPGGSASAAPAASASAAAVPVEKAKTEIGGKSISVAEMADIEAALKKAGWHSAGGGAMSMGAMKTITITAKKGKLEAKVSLVRPSGEKDTGSSMKMASAKSQEADFAKKGATLLDGNALLAVVIKDKKDEAKKLLDALVKK